MSSPAAPALDPALKRRLDDLFTRSWYSGAGYVFEAQPYTVAEDAPLLERVRDLRLDDRRHAQLLAELLESYDLVPEPGPFPYWHRDLNYLSVPHLLGFVLEALREDVARYEAALEALPETLRLARTTLRTILAEKRARIGPFEALVQEAQAREARAYAEAIAARKAARKKRLAEEAKAKEARRKSAGAGAGLPDPDEPGISPKEKARRWVLRRRVQLGKVAAPAAGAGGRDPAAGLPDPNEPGISPKEKARRAMALKRARAAGGGSAPAAAPADPAAGLPDPDEPGISPKEKARRTMAIKRARAAGGAG